MGSCSLGEKRCFAHQAVINQAGILCKTMQIRLATSITAPPLASWDLTVEGDRDPGDKGKNKNREATQSDAFSSGSTKTSSVTG